MFTQIISPIAYVYDAQTNKLIGYATFNLSSESEKRILYLVSKGAPFDNITVFNLNFHPTADYVAPVPLEPHRRKATFRALFTKRGTGDSIPNEIHGSFVTRMRSAELAQSYTSSADFYDIKVDSIVEIKQD